MKKKYYILLITLCFSGIIGCIAHRIPTSYIGNWKETPLEFSESISFQKKMIY